MDHPMGDMMMKAVMPLADMGCVGGSDKGERAHVHDGPARFIRDGIHLDQEGHLKHGSKREPAYSRACVGQASYAPRPVKRPE